MGNSENKRRREERIARLLELFAYETINREYRELAARAKCLRETTVCPRGVPLIGKILAKIGSHGAYVGR